MGKGDSLKKNQGMLAGTCAGQNIATGQCISTISLGCKMNRQLCDGDYCMANDLKRIGTTCVMHIISCIFYTIRFNTGA